MHERPIALDTYFKPAKFGVFDRLWFLALTTLSLGCVFIFFIWFPKFDIAASMLFYDAGTCGDAALCGGFRMASSLNYIVLRSVFYGLPFIVLVGIVLNNTVVFIKHKIPFWQDMPVISAIVASLILAPGLIVNMFLKYYVLRPRPRDVVIFGGDFPFVPVGHWQGLCTGNCSFVSGEASLAPFMVFAVLLFPKNWQKPALAILLPASIAMALLRVVFGAHYLSDVILGYGLTVLIFCVLAQVVNAIKKRNLLF